MILGYRVKVVDENGLKDLHQQDFMLTDFKDALVRAKEHKRRMDTLFPDDCVSLLRLRERRIIAEEEIQ